MKKNIYLLFIMAFVYFSCNNNMTEDIMKNSASDRQNQVSIQDGQDNTGLIDMDDDDDSLDQGYKSPGDEDVDLRVCLKWARAEVSKTSGNLAYAKLFGIIRTEISTLPKSVTIEYTIGDGVWKTFDAKDRGITNDHKFNKFYFSLPYSEKFKLSDGMGLVFEFKIRYNVGDEVVYAKKGYVFKANAMPTPNNPDYTQTVLGYAHVLAENVFITPVYDENQVLINYKLTSHVIVKFEPNYPTKVITMYYLNDDKEWRWINVTNYNAKLLTYTGCNFPYSNGYNYGIEDWYLETILPIDTPGIQFAFYDKLYKSNGTAGTTYQDKNRCKRYWMKMPTSNTPSCLYFNNIPQ